MRDNKGNAEEVSYRSWFGRVMYNYDNRYLLQANIRYDGSSRFHKNSAGDLSLHFLPDGL